MEKKINIGIVGCGAHAQIAHIPLFKKFPQCEIAALCDIDVRKIDYLSSKYSIPKKYQDFQEIIEDDEVHALIIATPDYLHAPMTISALKYGKHVLCESPMAINFDEALEMLEVAKMTERKLVLAMNNRLRPDVQTIIKFIRDGALGEIYYIKAGWLIGMKEWSLCPWRLEQLKSGGGVFHSLGTTLLDIALFFLKNKRPITIFASVHKREPKAEVEDTAMCMINFTDGTLLTIEVTWSLLFEKDFLYCNVFGKGGAALLNPLQVRKELHSELYDITPKIKHSNIYKESYERQTAYFLDCLMKDTPPPITCEDGLTIAKISQAFYTSAREHKLIEL